MGYSAKRDDRLQVRQAGNERRQKLAAGIDLGAGRFVLRRHAANSIDDSAIIERQCIIRPRFKIALSETIIFQCGIKQVTRIITGKGTAGTVGAA